MVATLPLADAVADPRVRVRHEFGGVRVAHAGVIVPRLTGADGRGDGLVSPNGVDVNVVFLVFVVVEDDVEVRGLVLAVGLASVGEAFVLADLVAFVGAAG